jgi:Zn finger protein HypA/HybF involved in hydrogenase expression
MHEISLVEDLVGAVTSQAQGREVTRVVVRHASTVPGDGLRETWASVVAGEPLASAELDATEVERRLTCPCGFDGVLGHDDVMGPVAVCPSCQAPHPYDPGAELELLEVATAEK